MTISARQIQQVIAYASIVMGILTQAVAGIHLSPIASAILGTFGVLLHPDTSVNVAPPAPSPPAPPPH